MLDTLLRYPEVKSYLNAYPREDWMRCVVATVRLGIRWTKQSGLRSGNVKDLEERVDGGEEGESMGALRQKMTSLKKELETMSRDLSGFDGNEGKGDYEDRPRKITPKSLPKRDKLCNSLKKSPQNRIYVPQTKLTHPTSEEDQQFQLPKALRSLRNLDLSSLLEPRTNETLVSHISEQTSGRIYTESAETESESGFLKLADEFLESPLVRRFL
jgi:hypothetical protein